MKGIRASTAITPAAAIASALTTLTCCLPWGIGAAFGALGLSAVFASFQIWFLILSVVLLFVGLFQVLRRGPGCRHRSGAEIILLSIAAAVVVAIVLFPQWVAGLLVGRLP
jgi:hypothetical protein